MGGALASEPVMVNCIPGASPRWQLQQLQPLGVQPAFPERESQLPVNGMLAKLPHSFVDATASAYTFWPDSNWHVTSN